MAVPAREIKRCIGRFQRLLKERGIDLALLRQNADLYYITGTVQDGHLFVPAEGEPLFLVWRVFERALAESPLKNIERLPGLSRLPDLLRERDWSAFGRIGLEFDVLPAELYLTYSRDIWPEAETVSVTHLVRTVRAVKSEWEIEKIRAACRQLEAVFSLIPDGLRPGMTDTDLAGALERALRRLGHPGQIRMRGWNQEVSAQVLSGPEGAMPSWVNTPGGGKGIAGAFGQGVCGRHLRPGEPISIDYAGFADGYLCDQTRLFCIGGLPEHLEKAFEAVLEFHSEFATRLVAGANSGELYEYAVRYFEELGYGDNFMGLPSSQVKFVGHGLGIEIDEYPFLSKGSSMLLESGMVVAVEPKLAFEGEGILGIEDTYLVTEEGPERLTLSPQELIVC